MPTYLRPRVRLHWVWLLGCLGAVGCEMTSANADEQGRQFLLAGVEARDWRLVQLLEEDSLGQTTDATAQLLGCDADDITTFRRDQSYAITEGATRCNPQDETLVEDGTYVLGPDAITLTPTGAGATFLWQLQVLKDDSLRVRVPLGNRARILTYFPVNP